MFAQRILVSLVALALTATLQAQGLLPIGADDLDEALLQPVYVQVTAVEKATGKPLEGVELELKSYVDRRRFEHHDQTDASGEGRVNLPESGKMRSVSIEGRAKGYVPIYMRWDDDSRKLEAPDSVRLEFEPGVSVGGRVVNSEGNAVEGVPIHVRIPATLSNMGNSFVFSVADPTTDADGRWRCDGVPEQMANLSISFKHPNYLRAGIYGPSRREALLKFEQLTVLEQGLSVSGVVLDEGGEPIEGAKLLFGSDHFGSDLPRATSDSQGRFTLRNCKEGALPVTVQAEGYSPDLLVTTAAKAGPEVTFKLGLAAKLRGKLVDPDGNPIAGAFFSADTWRSHRSLEWRINTDKEGRFSWDNAPHDAVQYDMGKQGFVAVRNRVIPADGTEQTIVMQPDVRISGTVVDSKGRAVPEFRVIVGRKYKNNNSMYWNRERGNLAFTRGKFELKFDEPAFESQLRIEAAGYRPVETEIFRLADGNRAFELQLEKGKQLTGTVVNPDGELATELEVVLLNERNQHVSVRAGAITNQSNVIVVKTDKHGSYQFMEQSNPCLVVALGQSGIGGLLTDRIAGKLKPITLRGWGRVTGTLKMGDQPGVGESISVNPRSNSSNSLWVRGVGVVDTDFEKQSPDRKDKSQSTATERLKTLGRSLVPAASALLEQGEPAKARNMLRTFYPSIWHNNSVETDTRGHFTFEHVIPGEFSVSRQLRVRFGPYSRTHGTHGVLGNVKSGQTAEVTIGGTGIAVVGKVASPKPAGETFSWGSSPPVSLQSNKQQGKSSYLSLIRSDGTFRIEDVSAGTYKLTVQVSDPKDQQSWHAGNYITVLTETVSITKEATAGDQPIDLGLLKPVPVKKESK